MYPDTDSAPIPLENEYIDNINQNLPSDIIDRCHRMKEWKIPEDTYTYIFSKNYYPVIEKIVNELNLNPRQIGTFFGHHLKWVEGHYARSAEFTNDQLFDLFRFLKTNRLDLMLAGNMLPVLYVHPKMDYESVLTSIGFKRVKKDDILSKAEFLKEKFSQIGRSAKPESRVNWVMGELRKVALGNVDLSELSKEIKHFV
jgi:glutamyl-tRNA(Gln) amidotransferase subunit E